MTPTSDERREVAERLRKAANFDEWLDVIINNAIFGVMGEVRHPISDTLADLIDPTCYLVDTTSTDGLHGPIIFSHELSCGHTCKTFWREPPAYCDVCGARVVEDAEGEDGDVSMDDKPKFCPVLRREGGERR